MTLSVDCNLLSRPLPSILETLERTWMVRHSARVLPSLDASILAGWQLLHDPELRSDRADPDFLWTSELWLCINGALERRWRMRYLANEMLDISYCSFFRRLSWLLWVRYLPRDRQVWVGKSLARLLTPHNHKILDTDSLVRSALCHTAAYRYGTTTVASVITVSGKLAVNPLPA